MAFDPSKPLDAANVQAAELRAQFNGLKELLEAGLADTAKNPSGVAPLSVSSGDFATQAIIEKVNELIASLQGS